MSAGWAIALIIAGCFIALMAWSLCVAADERKHPTPVQERGPCSAYEDVTCERWRECGGPAHRREHKRGAYYAPPSDCPFDAYECEPSAYSGYDAYETTTYAPPRTTYTVPDHDAPMIRAQRELVMSDLHMRAKGRGHERSET